MIHPIEEESYEILSRHFDFSRYQPFEAEVVKRIIHATADFDYAKFIYFSDNAAESAVAALANKIPVVCDVEMVRSGITRYETQCFLGQAEANPTGFPTRSHQAMTMAARRYPKGAIFVIGCAPTALTALVELEKSAWFEPALIIGLPVGFVGADESKVKLAESRFPCITNQGNKGGSAAAASAFNALARIALGDRRA